LFVFPHRHLYPSSGEDNRRSAKTVPSNSCREHTTRF
jgi:hypothetical protein